VLFISATVSGTENEWRVSPKPVTAPMFQATFTPTANGSPGYAPSVRNLDLTTERPRFVGLLASTTWLEGAFSTESEVRASQVYVPGDDRSPRMTRLAVTGSSGVVRYGMLYRDEGQAFDHRPAQDVREAWGEWKLGAMAIRSAVGQQRNTFDKDLVRPRVEQRYNRIDVSWSKAAWPRLSFKYAQNTASNTMDALSLFPQRADHHRLEAAIGYGGVMWDAKLASSYGYETDLLNHAAESQVQTQTLMASLRPLAALTITPTLGYRAERPEWSAARIDSPSASLAMSYTQSQRLSMTVIGNYFGLRSTDKLIELDNIGGKGIVSWELEPLRDWKPQISLEGGYNLQVNRLMPSVQTENISGLLRVVLATM
jgi:hypothetical protein